MIKYIGSKRLLIPQIVALVESVVPPGALVCDLFSGTSRVGVALRQRGYRVWANDSAAYAATIARAYLSGERADNLVERIKYLNELPGTPGYFTKTFCEESRFFQPVNGAKVDAIRDVIEDWYLAGDIDIIIKSILLTSLMEAADRVDSTVGLQMAYLKDWATRSFNPLELRPLEIPEGPLGWASQCDALEFVTAAKEDYSFDLTYCDSPYNQHSYRSNYHIWESLVLWDKPETFGIAKKRVDCKTLKSPYNYKKTALPTLEAVVAAVKSRYVLLSFNNEGFISLEEMTAMLGKYGKLDVFEVDHKRHVGSAIGIYNLIGEKVGTPGAKKNLEYFYLLEKA